jgi:hypothetical protein
VAQRIDVVRGALVAAKFSWQTALTRNVPSVSRAVESTITHHHAARA